MMEKYVYIFSLSVEDFWSFSAPMEELLLDIQSFSEVDFWIFSASVKDRNDSPHCSAELAPGTFYNFT